ncbi:putative Outer membrane protein, OmpA/MotB family [Candidatus Zixiibacteriota bacterium]|nr:putative Outer membrane protein, OmpA/MotB family [candidate division Zixibacteria bacterium]
MGKKLAFAALVAVLLLIAGCASKGYVDKQIADMQTKVQADVSSAKAQSDANAVEIQKIQAATDELSKKTDKALNQAKGFENYQVIWEGTVNYAFDSYDLNQVATDNLEALGQKMIDVKQSILEIAGYTDRTGPASYNFELGIKRAEAVKTHMTDKFGIPLYRMYTVSYGKTKPVAMPDEANANAKNRRVVLKLWGPLQ